MHESPEPVSVSVGHPDVWLHPPLELAIKLLKPPIADDLWRLAKAVMAFLKVLG